MPSVSCSDDLCACAFVFTFSFFYFYMLHIDMILFVLCLQVRIARIFNTYGPRMCLDDGRVVSNFVAQVLIFIYYSMFFDIAFSFGCRCLHEIFSFTFYTIDWQAIRREPMTVYGDGKQTRSFQYVSDLVSSPWNDFMFE